MFKKTTLSFLLSLSLYSHFSLAGSGKDVGNGGGGLLLGGKHYTFAELGIKPSADETTPYESEVLEEVDNILPKSLGEGRKVIIKNIISMDKPYIDVKVIAPQKFKKILDDYQSALEGHFDSHAFQVYAITNNSNTFIFPSFYQLGLKQQAAILIHESFFRGNPKSELKKVLKFDFELKQFNDKKETGKPVKSIDLLHQFNQLSFLYYPKRCNDCLANYTSDTEVISNILQESNLDNIPFDGDIANQIFFPNDFQEITVNFTLLNNKKRIFSALEMRYLLHIKKFTSSILSCMLLLPNKKQDAHISFKQMKVIRRNSVNNFCDLSISIAD